MFEVSHRVIDDRTHKYVISRNGDILAYADALNLWEHDDAFRTCFISLLIDSPFAAYRWETPPVTNETIERDFEFVLLNSPGLVRTADSETYADHFTSADEDRIAVFDNLSKDAVLVVPAPCATNSTYEHLAAFIRSAPDSQRHALWRIVGQTVKPKITDRPLWVSTAGGGVAWLHVRLDSRPKYYGYVPYKKCA